MEQTLIGRRRGALVCFLALAAVSLAQEVPPPRPRAGKVETLKSAEVKRGMRGWAWTVFESGEPEPVPVEILGLWKNAWGPRQDIILAKMGGKAVRTNVAGGMSGSPVYIDGKLIGAVALRLSVFSPDAICGITPIELMLEIQDFDRSRPADARTPDRLSGRAALEMPGAMLQAVTAGRVSSPLFDGAVLAPIATPLAFSGFHSRTLEEFGPLFQQLGMAPVQGGAAADMHTPKPAAGWQKSLQPGDAVTAVLVSGDMSITGLGTVTLNDGKRVLAFGHPFFNLGPVDMPMSKAEVLLVNASSFQPNKLANATAIVGAIRQDRHSGIQGVLGESADMVPVGVTVRGFDSSNEMRNEKKFRFQVFVQQKWTPYLMMVTLFNSISDLNDFMDDTTFRLSGQVELDGQPNLSLATMQAPGEMSVPAPMLLAGWWGDKFNRLFLNAVKTPRLKRVNVTVDLLPQRRVATIENAWIATDEARPGEELPVKVYLRPYRGARIERELHVKIPAAMPGGQHRILLSDADTLNRMQNSAGLTNRFLDLPEAVSLINKERSNNKLYVSLVESRPAVYYDDKTLPALPASVLNVMQSGRSASRPFLTSAESALEQMAVPFDFVVSGSYFLRITVK